MAPTQALSSGKSAKRGAAASFGERIGSPIGPSITISGLKYVVDIGYSKVPSYDEKMDTVKLNVEKISEASRKQRRGRVGRHSNGEVYWLDINLINKIIHAYTIDPFLDFDHLQKYYKQR